jgi:hypothetical protein
MAPMDCDHTPTYHNWQSPPAIYEHCRDHYYPVDKVDIQDVDQDEVNEWIAGYDVKEFPKNPAHTETQGKTVKEMFQQHAEKWEQETGPISSVKDLTAHPSYQAIIGLGWDVVPILLTDLRERKRFWFPALNSITSIRPFDPGDAGNRKRMTAAWIQWGKRKGLI